MNHHTPSSKLRPEDVPSGSLAAFAFSFDGYAHFGSTEAAMRRAAEIRAGWAAAGRLPENVEDLRACLFVEFRRERFVDLDGTARVTRSDGTVLHEPDPSKETPARAEQERYKRALAAHIADMLRRRPDAGAR